MHFSCGHQAPYVPPLSSRPITWVSGDPPKVCAQWDKIPQNFWVGGMRLGYSRGSWCVLRVPMKLLFGHTNNVGFDPFLRYPGCTPLAAVRSDRSRSAGCGRPTFGRSSCGKVLELAAAGCWSLLVGCGCLGCAGACHWHAAAAPGLLHRPMTGHGWQFASFGQLGLGWWLATAT